MAGDRDRPLRHGSLFPTGRGDRKAWLCLAPAAELLGEAAGTRFSPGEMQRELTLAHTKITPVLLGQPLRGGPEPSLPLNPWEWGHPACGTASSLPGRQSQSAGRKPLQQLRPHRRSWDNRG